MIKYPNFLPGPLLAGYTLNQQSNLLRSEMDSGQARSRRRFKNVPSIISSTWMFTSEQAGLFEAFIEYGLTGGTAWFEVPIKTAAGIKTGQLRFVSNPLENCKTLSPTRWQYSAKIELKTRPLITQEKLVENLLAPQTFAEFTDDTNLSSYQTES